MAGVLLGRRQIVDKLTFEVIKKSVKILKIDKDNFIVTIGSPKGYWSKGLKMSDKKIHSPHRWWHYG